MRLKLRLPTVTATWSGASAAMSRKYCWLIEVYRHRAWAPAARGRGTRSAASRRATRGGLRALSVPAPTPSTYAGFR
jgi:hypothetical protein